MPAQPLRVAFLWHQHQPYYKLGNSYLLPWTRLHATKDYHDIIATLDRFPKIRQTVNVVPSLLIQLIDYVKNGATDLVLDLSRRPAAELTSEEKVQILRYFFLCNVERMVLPYPRYAALYHKAGNGERNDLAKIAQLATSFSTGEWLDLQVWYNLTWIGEYSRLEEPFAGLLAKGQGFTEEEKHALLDASLAIMAKVIPTYRRLMESGRIELSVTPFYHPILPVLCDSHAALEALPNLTLPEHHIELPEDATVHISRAIDLFREEFGRAPEGMWPSEGSVSDQALGLIRGAGLTWAATDEGVLRRTLGEGWSGLAKYFPYTLKTRSGPLWLFFRDHELSDAIGFVYSSWKPQDAALDFYNRLVELRSRIIQEHGAAQLDEAVVSIILDGENCWEYYEQNGRPFLESLYTLLSESQEITTVTIGEGVRDRQPHRDRTLGRVFSGSWIGTNFKIWIGHEEDNTAWDALIEARNTLMEAKPALPAETFARAMEEIYIAEGSDWFWWFGDENSSANQDDFDDLFRAHLRNVYEIIGKEAPAQLDVPIRKTARAQSVIMPTGFVSPTIDGARSEHDWEHAGYFIVERVGGAMHRADAFDRRVWFGRDERALYVRFDTTLPFEQGESVRLSVTGARTVTLHFSPASVAIETSTDERGCVAITGLVAAIGDTLEAAIPLEHLKGTGDIPEAVGIVCEIFEHGHPIERFPHQGEVICPLPRE